MPANRTDWKTEPFEQTVPILYEASFTAEEMERIKNGLIPAAMEDKWFIYYDAPHLFLHRSWTGNAIYRVEFEETQTGSRVASDVAADKVHSVEILQFLISGLMLGKDAPFPKLK